MLGHAVLAVALAMTAPAPAAQPRPQLSVMTWNVCAGTNPACFLYRGTPQELAWNIGTHVGEDTDVLFLQEFCTGADAALEGWLEQHTGRAWTVRSWGLVAADGTPYACHADTLGRPRGTQSVTVAVADDAAVFETHALTSPPWAARRAVLCATIPAKRVRACGTHLSSGLPNDDHQPGAPYRTAQVRELLGAAARPGYLPVFGGDLNLKPQRDPIARAYRTYQECDPRRRDTRAGKKIDYLFATRGSVLGCRVDQRTRISDHQPLYVKVGL